MSNYKYNHPYTVAEFKEILSELPICFETREKGWFRKPCDTDDTVNLYAINDNSEYWPYQWLDGSYTGTFTLIDPCEGKKPQPFEVGDYVEVLENARECGDFKDWRSEKKEYVSSTGIIRQVFDDSDGISYIVDEGWLLPHYCLRKVDPPKPKTVTLELTKEQLQKIQDILKINN